MSGDLSEGGYKERGSCREGGRKNGELYSSLVPLLSSSATATSSPPSMPLPLCLGGRMMMNRLAARKQNISSRGRFGNWLSTSAEPWPHNRFEPARTSWFIKQPLINALLSGQGRPETQRPNHSNMNSTCKKKKDRSACVCVFGWWNSAQSGCERGGKR